MAIGTEGMKYSLVSREVISDCVETCVQGQWMDGVVVIGGCDKNMPGGMMGLLRANVPGIYVYGGTILPGKLHGQDLNIVSVFEAVGENAAGKISDQELKDVEQHAIPGTGSCGGMYTANTMSAAFEAMGMSLPYSSTIQSARRKTKLRARIGQSRHRSRQKRPQAARHRHPPIHRKRRGRHHGHRRLHQRRAALSGHRSRRRRGLDD